MNLSDLKTIFKILKQNKISKGTVANELAISPGYISKILSGEKNISTQFVESLYRTYKSYIPKSITMQNKILATNLRRARILLGYGLNESIESFGYNSREELYANERGETEPGQWVVDNIYKELLEFNFVDEHFDLATQYLDDSDNVDLKKSLYVADAGHSDELNQAAEPETGFDKKGN